MFTTSNLMDEEEIKKIETITSPGCPTAGKHTPWIRARYWTEENTQWKFVVITHISWGFLNLPYI